ncbi:MAG TPA: transcriptional regulator BetI [Mesorhizobium sp.]|jgi:TetR/AcrR family transcriptional repressor of bet genes|nr:transcriptional regulator BetI [Mesorhizobium sp.]
MRNGRTSIEQIRRRDLIDAAYQTFLEHGLQGMTMARIGERAGMSHGIVNYYFASKDELVSAVVRKANFLIMQGAAQRLKAASSPRERVSAIIASNFTSDLFTRDTARAWVSYYAAIGRHPEFERLQNVVDRRLHSNLMHALGQLTTRERASEIAQGVALFIDGLWLRRARSGSAAEDRAAIATLESFVDRQLGRPHRKTA